MKENKNTNFENENLKTEQVEDEALKHEQELNEKVGIKVDYSTLTPANLLKALIFSGLGIFIFFIPCVTGADGEALVPMVYLVNTAKEAASGILNHLVMIVCIGLSITYTIGKIKKDSYFGRFHEKDGPVTGLLYYLSAVFSTMLVFNVGPEHIVNPDVGGLAITLAGSTLFTVTIAGWLVTFLIEFGVLEFIGTLIEPIMRRVFLLPGQSAVDALSSFVAAPAVGVFITNKLYDENVYTEKEACCIMTNFSVVSLGFFALLVSITDTQYMYGSAVLTSLLTVFILAIIVIRIPPLSRKKEQFRNGTMQTAEMKHPGKYDSKIFKKAIAAATTKASGTQYKVFLTAFEDVFSFALKVVSFVQALTVISMLISTYTPAFDLIGKPMVPYLKLMGLENAAEIAPATLVGIAEIALPVMTIAGKAIAPASIFFVIVLSTVQIIFFTESANAMLQSDAGLSVGQLVMIFIIRTIIAVPIVALFAKLLYA